MGAVPEIVEGKVVSILQRMVVKNKISSSALQMHLKKAFQLPGLLDSTLAS